jgi:ribosomal protein S18 acetylase RimI-like enzyme
MTTIVPVTPQNVAICKSVRLVALRETPTAFGATYAKESQLTDTDWVNRAINWNGEKGIMLLAMDGAEACGMAGCYLHQEDPTCAQLVSMWTAPEHRRHGVGRLLVNEVLTWAQQRNARALFLTVTSSNEPAILFYEGLGFTRTGRTEPYPNDPALSEYEMSRPTSP